MSHDRKTLSFRARHAASFLDVPSGEAQPGVSLSRKGNTISCVRTCVQTFGCYWPDARASLKLLKRKAGAQPWFQARADKAREEHEHWLSVTPEVRAALEKQYMLGETIKVPDADDQLESLLRVELLEVIPEFMSKFAKRHAIFGSVAVISMVMRKLLPSHEFSRMGIAFDWSW
eukprot:6181989-Amphidinium_carterae.2